MPREFKSLLALVFNNIKILFCMKIKKETLVRNAFLLPILSVVFISISHVVRWYDMGNPVAWAIYLSVAVEIFALASVAAASVKIEKFSIWILFSIVTFIQIAGNIFFTYNEIDINNALFKNWVELIEPWFPEWTIVEHRRLLAYIQGGTLPLMSLIALHFYISFQNKINTEKAPVETGEPQVEESQPQEKAESPSASQNQNEQETPEPETRSAKTPAPKKDENATAKTPNPDPVIAPDKNKNITANSRPETNENKETKHNYNDKKIKELLKEIKQKEDGDKIQPEEIIQKIKKEFNLSKDLNNSEQYRGHINKPGNWSGFHPQIFPGIN